MAQRPCKGRFTTIILFPHLHLRKYLALSINFVLMIKMMMICEYQCTGWDYMYFAIVFLRCCLQLVKQIDFNWIRFIWFNHPSTQFTLASSPFFWPSEYSSGYFFAPSPSFGSLLWLHLRLQLWASPHCFCHSSQPVYLEAWTISCMKMTPKIGISRSALHLFIAPVSIWYSAGFPILDLTHLKSARMFHPPLVKAPSVYQFLKILELSACALGSEYSRILALQFTNFTENYLSVRAH